MTDKHFVYVIACIQDDLPVAVKVGVSTSPWGRVAALQTGCPFKLELVCCFRLSMRKHAFDIERGFGEEHARERISSEWFDMDPVEAIRGIMEFFVEVERQLGCEHLIAQFREQTGHDKIAQEFLPEGLRLQ